MATAKAEGSVTITATDTNTSVKASKVLNVSYHKINPDIWNNGLVTGIDENHGSIVPATIKGGTEPISAIKVQGDTLRVELDGHDKYTSLEVTYDGYDHKLRKGSGAFYEITNSNLANTMRSDWKDGEPRAITIKGVI